MYKNKCLYWEHGTLLYPQHFQILDQKAPYYASLFSQIALPYMWGFKDLRIQHEALATNMVLIDALEFMGLGGEHIILGDNAHIAPRVISPELFETGNSIIVYVGLASWSNQAGNVTDCDIKKREALNVKTRYIASYDPEVVHDLHGNGSLADMRFISYNLQLIWETEKELLQSVNSIPVARIVKDGDNFSFDPEFIPPCVDIYASPRITAWLSSILNMLRARERQLSEYKLLPLTPDKVSIGVGVNTQSLALYFMLAAVSRALPLLEHLLQTPAMHPWMVFGALRQIIGELSMFSVEFNCAGESMTGEHMLPSYTHDNCGQCFKCAHDIFVKLTSTLITGPAHTFIFENKNDQFLVNIPPHIRSLPYHYWIQIRANHAIDQICDIIKEKAKFAPPNILPTLIAKSLSGIGLSHSEKPPTGMPSTGDTLYFSIDVRHPLWQHILNEGDATLFLPQLPQGTTIHLILVNT